jgi:hypothetical protein
MFVAHGKRPASSVGFILERSNGLKASCCLPHDSGGEVSRSVAVPPVDVGGHTRAEMGPKNAVKVAAERIRSSHSTKYNHDGTNVTQQEDHQARGLPHSSGIDHRSDLRESDSLRKL